LRSPTSWTSLRFNNPPRVDLTVFRLITWMEKLGDFCILSWDVIVRIFFKPLSNMFPNFNKILKQIYRMGLESIPIVSLISVFIGMILSIQTAYQLQKFGATAYVGTLVSVSVVRELGPLLTAILLAGRIGAGITAELGSMVVSEEVTALRTMAINPRKYLLVPRNLALIISLPILTLMANILAILGGMFVSWQFLNVPPGQFYRLGVDALILKDLMTGFTKSIVFAFVIALIASYKGFNVRGGATAVGEATTQTVVLSIVYIIAADLVFTIIFYIL